METRTSGLAGHAFPFKSIKEKLTNPASWRISLQNVKFSTKFSCTRTVVRASITTVHYESPRISQHFLHPHCLPFQIVDVTVDKATNKATITWSSKPARVYTLERSVNLGPWIEVDDGIDAADGETTTAEDEFEAGTSEIYYRVIEP
ncbi:MAG: hypothetical protein ACI9R3_001071 [Verrucomicrobiales bacterium]|jgi:hypothetical protein